MSFEIFNSQKGLSQNSGYAITQDKTGFMWFGTQDGLNRFDGYEIRTFRRSTVGKELPENYISALLTDHEGNIWIGTQHGLCVHRNTSNSILPAKDFLGKETSLDSASIVKFFKDSSQNIWILTQFRGSFVYQAGDKTLRHFSENIVSICEDEKNNTWLISDNCFYFYKRQQGKLWKVTPEFSAPINLRDIVCTANNKLWVATFRDGIYTYSVENQSLVPEKHFSKKSQKGLKSNDITCLLTDSKMNVWAGTRNSGIYQMDVDGNILSHSYHTGRGGINELNKNFVLSIYEDRQGTIWVGLSGGGIAQYDPNKIKFEKWANLQELNQENEMIFTIRQFRKKYIFIGTQTSGLLQYDIDSQKFLLFQRTEHPHSIIHNTVYGIDFDDEGRVWLATWGGLCYYQRSSKSKFTRVMDESDLLHTKLYSVLKICGRDSLLVSGDNGLFYYNLKEKTFETVSDKNSFNAINTITARMMYEDDEGVVWLATERLGLLGFSISDNTIEKIPLTSGHALTVRYIFPADSSLFWLATDEGLMRFNKKTRQVEQTWTTNEGLPSDVTYAVLPDRDGNLWISSNGGLSKLNPDTGFVRSYDEADGLQSLEFNTACCLKDDMGYIYFGGINGINRFPESLTGSNFSPPVVFTGFYVRDSLLHQNLLRPNEAELKLKPDQNFLTINFSTLNYSNTRKTSYQYQLRGIDEKWIDHGHRNAVNYTNLPPGSHTFMVRASNADGIGNDQVSSVSFFIKSRWFQTLAFKIGVVLFLAVILTGFYRYRVNQILRLQSIRNRISADLHDELGSSLSGISIMGKLARQNIQADHPANQFLTRIVDEAQQIGGVLDDIVWNISPKNDTLGNMIARMTRYASELFEATQIRYRFSFPEQIEKLRLSMEQRGDLYLVFKEAVTNLVKYSQCSLASVSITVLKKSLVLKVEDDGVGFDTTKQSERNGIRNMMERSKKLKGKLDIRSEFGKGTTIQLEFPIRE